VNFTLGGTALGSANLVSGKATSTWLVSSTTGFAAGANTIVANYVGDGNFNASSASTMLTMVPTYSASNAIPAYVGPGGTTTSTFTLKSDGYAGTVSFVATANSSEITASAAPVILTAGGTANATVTISASKNAANHVPGLPWKTGGALVFCVVLLGAPYSARRKPIMTVLLAAAAILAAGFLISCGGGGSGSSGPSQPRNYSITVTPTGSGVVTNAPGVTVSLVVQ
jgi:hypothetical protein